MRRRQLQDGVRLTLSSEIPSKKKLKETKTYVQCILLYGIKKEIPTIRVALQKRLPSRVVLLRSKLSNCTALETRTKRHGTLFYAANDTSKQSSRNSPNRKP